MKSTLFLVSSLLCAAFVTIAQEKSPVIGSWEGKLPVGNGLRIVFHIESNEKGGLSAAADSPDQGAFGMKCDTVWFTGNELIIEMRSLNASYKGKLANDTSISGEFTQGAAIPLHLVKKAGVKVVRKRPQEPKSPFPYKAEDIIYTDQKSGRQYGATITIPAGKGPFPAALLISGSGPQNRDEELFGHKPFAVLADALTRNGMVVLRVDDRGVGKTTGPFRNATSADFADDAREAVKYLLSRPEVNKKKIGIIGHSEGGMIAPMVAAGRDDIDFIVLLAGPGIPIIQLLVEQNAAIARTSGVSEPAIQAYTGLYREVNKAVMSTPDSAAALAKAIQAVRSWRLKTDTVILQQLGITSLDRENQMAAGLTESMHDKWFRYFASFEPAPYLEKLRCKVLALNGEKDVQVLPASNLAGIEAALRKSKSKGFVVKELPGLNHLFQRCKTCSPAEYGELEETFAPAALDEINNWLTKNVK